MIQISNVTSSISGGAFSGCSSLGTISIPAGVTVSSTAFESTMCCTGKRKDWCNFRGNTKVGKRSKKVKEEGWIQWFPGLL